MQSVSLRGVNLISKECGLRVNLITLSSPNPLTKISSDCSIIFPNYRHFYYCLSLETSMHNWQQCDCHGDYITYTLSTPIASLKLRC